VRRDEYCGRQRRVNPDPELSIERSLSRTNVKVGSKFQSPLFCLQYKFGNFQRLAASIYNMIVFYKNEKWRKIIFHRYQQNMES